jgi:hypothetical protein
MAGEELPPNIREFNEITGVIFAQLYQAFPLPEQIDPSRVAQMLGYGIDAKLGSGRPFNVVMAHALVWLADEGFTERQTGINRFRLASKGLAAMNAVPEKLDEPLGKALAAASAEASDDTGKRKLVELVGSFLGSFTGSVAKSLGGA